MTVAFALEEGIVGTIRAVPMHHGLTLAEDLLQVAAHAVCAPPAASWEIGRLVIDPGWRGGIDSLRRCLHLAMSFLHQHREVGHLYAACTAELARLYRRFGFEVIAQGVPLAGTEKIYTLIHAPTARAIAALAGRPTRETTS